MKKPLPSPFRLQKHKCTRNLPEESTQNLERDGLNHHRFPPRGIQKRIRTNNQYKVQGSVRKKPIDNSKVHQFLPSCKRAEMVADRRRSKDTGERRYDLEKIGWCCTRQEGRQETLDSAFQCTTNFASTLLASYEDGASFSPYNNNCPLRAEKQLFSDKIVLVG